jgi:hypothetical protein
MAIWIKPTKVTLWKNEDKGNYSVVTVSSGRKLQDSEEWKNSNWSFVRFVGQAHEAVKNLEEKARIILETGYFSIEPYEMDGEKKYPKASQLVVFKISVGDAPSEKSQMDTAPAVDDDEDFPF